MLHNCEVNECELMSLNPAHMNYYTEFFAILLSRAQANGNLLPAESQQWLDGFFLVLTFQVEDSS